MSRICGLEIWPFRLGNFGDRSVKRDIVFGANGFSELSGAGAAIGLPRRPRHVERTRIFDADRHLQRLSAFGHLESLDHVKLRRVRRAVVIDVGVVGKTDRIDDQGIAAFVVSDDSP